MAIQIKIEPVTTSVSVSAATTTVTANLGVTDASASSVTITPTGTITATTLQGALEQLAAQDFRTTEAPTGDNVEEGDTWYDTDNDIFYVYRTVNGVTDWQALLTTGTPDESDGGTF